MTDGGLPVRRRRRLRAVVEVGDSVTRHRPGDESAVVAPVEADPWPALPGCLVLHVRGHVIGFVVVDAENSCRRRGRGPGSRDLGT